MILFPQKPFYCGVHELSNVTVKFSSPPGTLCGRKHGFALFTRKGDFRATETDKAQEALCWALRQAFRGNCSDECSDQTSTK